MKKSMKKVIRLFSFSLILLLITLPLMFLCGGCGRIGITSGKVGSTTRTILTPYNQVLDPAGILLSYGTPDSEQHAMDCSLSPDGSMLAVEGRFNLVLVNTKTKRVASVIPLGKDNGVYEGVIWSKDGKDIYLTTTAGHHVKPKIGKILDIKVGKNAEANITTLFKFSAKNGKPALPNDIKISKDGNYMYVALNGSNEVAKFDIKNKKMIWKKKVAKFPYGIALAHNKLYVTEWGGRKTIDGDSVAKAGWNSVKKDENIVADPKTGAAASGVVTVMDSKSGKIINTVNVGLHPNDIISSKNGNKIYVANANSDTVSVIGTNKDEVIETISVSPNKLPFGCSPTALTLSQNGKYLYVADGMINAVAVIELGKEPVDNTLSTLKRSKAVGFVPTGAYPGGLDISKDGKVLYVADTEGMLSTVTTNDTKDKIYSFLHHHKNVFGKSGSTAGAYNTHKELGYVSIINIPDKESLNQYTKEVSSNIKYKEILKNIKTLTLHSRKGIAPKPIPERLGEPSVFKHVIYIIKENRSYDQILGDMKEGNGDKYLTVFGENTTPNHHELAKDFLLMDNYYVPSKCSAEGHPWVDSAYITDYVEKNVRGWFRGYYHVILDAMVAPKTGYIWDDVLTHGKTFRDYGEGLKPVFANRKITWFNAYNDFLFGKKVDFKNKGTIEHLVKYSSKDYPGYDSHRTPDALRAKIFIKELHKYEEKGSLPNFIIMALPSDHTDGTKYGYPTPSAMVADNDLALGRIVDAVSHSKFWKDTVIFVTEDDSQDGWDHVSAYRTVGYVISPYSRLHKVVHTYYNTLSMMHTMEQILGIPPMNIFDMSASLMHDCFTDKPDYTPYNHAPNNIPLDTMNPSSKSLSGRALHWNKVASKMSDEIDDPDNDQNLNKMIWYSVKGYNTPYPEKYVLPEEGSISKLN